MYKKRFLVKEGKSHVPIKTHEIAYFNRDDDFVFIELFKGKTYIIDMSINSLETVLDPKVFIRLSRKILANIDSIIELNKEGQDIFEITLSANKLIKIPVSREKYYIIKSFLSE